MAASFLRSRASIGRLLASGKVECRSLDLIPPYRLHHRQQRLGFANFMKRGKEVDAAAPNLASSSLGSTFAERFGIVGWYLGMVKSRPVLTKSITCCAIYIAADLSSQTISLSPSTPYDFVRTSRMAGYGLIILGPTLHYWFNFMSRVLPGRDLLSTVKKMALGQSVYGPLMTIIFFSMNAALQGEDYGEVTARLKRDLFPTLLNGIMFWPACDFITFRFVPVHLQPLVSNSFSYIWTIYLTYVASREKASLEEAS